MATIYKQYTDEQREKNRMEFYGWKQRMKKLGLKNNQIAESLGKTTLAIAALAGSGGSIVTNEILEECNRAEERTKAEQLLGTDGYST